MHTTTMNKIVKGAATLCSHRDALFSGVWMTLNGQWSTKASILTVTEEKGSDSGS